MDAERGIHDPWMLRSGFLVPEMKENQIIKVTSTFISSFPGSSRDIEKCQWFEKKSITMWKVNTHCYRSSFATTSQGEPCSCKISIPGAGWRYWEDVSMAISSHHMVDLKDMSPWCLLLEHEIALPLQIIACFSCLRVTLNSAWDKPHASALFQPC